MSSTTRRISSGSVMRLTLAAYLFASIIGSGLHFHFGGHLDARDHDASAIVLHAHADHQAHRMPDGDIVRGAPRTHDHPVATFLALAAAVRLRSANQTATDAPHMDAIDPIDRSTYSPASGLLTIRSDRPLDRDLSLLLPARAPPFS
jgi:hypothetical protein